MEWHSPEGIRRTYSLQLTPFRPNNDWLILFPRTIVEWNGLPLVVSGVSQMDEYVDALFELFLGVYLL